MLTPPHKLHDKTNPLEITISFVVLVCFLIMLGGFFQVN
jgi:hypothetical protein